MSWLSRSPRQFVDDIFRNAHKSVRGNKFSVNLKNTLWAKKDELLVQFFENEGPQNDESYTVAQFIVASYNVSGTTSAVSDSSDEDIASETEVEGPKTFGELQLFHNFSDTEIRRTVAEFGRCFCSGSIA